MLTPTFLSCFCDLPHWWETVAGWRPLQSRADSNTPHLDDQTWKVLCQGMYRTTNRMFHQTTSFYRCRQLSVHSICMRCLFFQMYGSPEQVHQRLKVICPSLHPIQRSWHQLSAYLLGRKMEYPLWHFYGLPTIYHLQQGNYLREYVLIIMTGPITNQYMSFRCSQWLGNTELRSMEHARNRYIESKQYRGTFAVLQWRKLWQDWGGENGRRGGVEFRYSNI